MNMRNGILGLLFMAIVPLSAQTSERGLKECIRMGIERNLGLKNARISIDSGRTTVTQARANLLPQVNGTLQAGDYLIRPVNVTTSTLLNADFPDSPTWGKVRTMPLTAQGALQVGVPLYNATIHAAIDAAKVVEDLNRVSYEKARLDLATQIAQIYFMAQATLENRHLLDENIERMDTLCQITEQPRGTATVGYGSSGQNHRASHDRSHARHHRQHHLDARWLHRFCALFPLSQGRICLKSSSRTKKFGGKWNNLQVLESFRIAELCNFDYLCDQYEKIGL